MAEVMNEFTKKTGGGRYEHTFLSNFYVEPDGTTVEHEFQAAKTLDLREKVDILSAATPGQAKKLGRAATLRPNWEAQKYHFMRDLVLLKFLDHPELARKLVETGDAYLIEGNTWHDNCWGVCYCEKCEANQKDGENLLGLILMEIRDLIHSYDTDPQEDFE